MDNGLQSEYWNGPGGARWLAGFSRIDRGLARITEALFAHAAPRAGERVLDVGCGTAATTLALQRLGARPLGVDISTTLAGAAPAGVEVVVADAATRGFAPEFDLVFSRFGVMFFADPPAAFANLRRALAPGGRLAFACWRPLAENPWAATPLEAARPLLPPLPPPDPHAPGPFALADADRLRGILAAAGWRDIAIASHDSTMWMGATLDEAADEALTVGPLARIASELPDELRARIRERVREALVPFAGDREVAPPATVWLVGAR